MDNLIYEKYIVYGKNNILTHYGFRAIKELQNHQIRFFPSQKEAKSYMKKTYCFIEDYEIKKVRLIVELTEHKNNTIGFTYGD